jgi:tRNA threonylcarbamoyladenosine biosynthesis protein TsaE
MKYVSNSIDETLAIGEKLGRELKPGDVVAMIGDLGSGKTVLTKGIAKGLGVKDTRYVNSPTFVIIKEYEGHIPLYHFDIYRLNRYTLVDDISFEEYFYGDGVTVVEWADKIPELLPKKRIEIRLSVEGESKRKIEIRKVTSNS